MSKPQGRCTLPASTALAILLVQGLLPGPRASQQQPQDAPGRDEARFRSGIELINVTATVTDSRGHFVSGLRREDFRVFEDGEPQTITHFSNERVPVSLGIALDTSGSMAGEKLRAANQALNRFLFELLGPSDEVFLCRFSNQPELVQGWTEDRRTLSQALGSVRALGGTALLDTLAAIVPLAGTGQHRKKAVLIISDGYDTVSTATLVSVKQLIRESEVLVYAVGVDGPDEPAPDPRVRRPGPVPVPLPPIPRPPRWPWPIPRGGLPRRQAAQGRFTLGSGMDGGVNIAALRQVTDDSGGRTETIRTPRDLDPATSSIADELSKQYYLGYPSTMKSDGRWHAIRVEVGDGSFLVRARRGYVATPH
jgi:Ca-activated chloride channel homolog